MQCSVPFFFFCNVFNLLGIILGVPCSNSDRREKFFPPISACLASLLNCSLSAARFLLSFFLVVVVVFFWELPPCNRGFASF